MAGIDVAALMMDELIPKERRGASAQRHGRMVVKGCFNGNNKVVIRPWIRAMVGTKTVAVKVIENEFFYFCILVVLS